MIVVGVVVVVIVVGVVVVVVVVDAVVVVVVDAVVEVVVVAGVTDCTTTQANERDWSIVVNAEMDGNKIRLLTSIHAMIRDSRSESTNMDKAPLNSLTSTSSVFL